MMLIASHGFFMLLNGTNCPSPVNRPVIPDVCVVDFAYMNNYGIYSNITQDSSHRLPPHCTCFPRLVAGIALALFIFTSLEALPIFLQEQSIYTREHSRGAYRVISYSLANFLIYIPVFAAMSVVFTSISYFMIDLPPSGFGFQIMAIFFVLLSSNAFATFVSGIAPDPLTVSVQG